VDDPIAIREYQRFVARLIGIELAEVESAMGRGQRSRRKTDQTLELPLDRAESELLRVVLGNPPGLKISASDFSDERLRLAFLSVEGQLADAAPGTPLDLSTIEDAALQGIVRGLALDSRPLPDWADMKERVRMRRIDAEIIELERKLAGTEEGTQTHSDYFRRLIALQKEKRSSGE
jgi:hypothetical protein